MHLAAWASGRMAEPSGGHHKTSVYTSVQLSQTMDVLEYVLEQRAEVRKVAELQQLAQEGEELV